jgi:hypothetical protein
MEGLLSLPSGTILSLVNQFVARDPSLLGEMSKGALSQPITRFSKQMMVKSFTVLESSDIIKLLGDLPKDLLAQVACMIDPGELAQVLSTNFASLISSM